MRLLFDQNLSFRLVEMLADVYPNAAHVRQLGLERAEDAGGRRGAAAPADRDDHMAMIFGMLPTAMALGDGGEFRAPMARAVIGGLITSTLLTLIVVPVVYTYLDDFGATVAAWVKGWNAAPEEESAAAPAAPPEPHGVPAD